METKEKFFLKRAGEKKWKEVTKSEWIQAEREAGFQPKMSSSHPQYMNTCATAGFNGNGISGKVEYNLV